MMPSIFFIAVGFSFGIYSIYEKVWNKVLMHEFYPLIAALFILIAIQLISVGLIMDYIVKKLDRIEEN